MVSIDRATADSLKRLRSTFAHLDESAFSNLAYLGNVLIVGGSNASGFGMSLARGVLATEPRNRVVITGRQSKKLDTLKASIASGGTPLDSPRTEVYALDVENPEASDLTTRQFDHIVVAAAFMDPRFLKRSIAYQDIPADEISKSRAVVVDGFYNVLESIGLLHTSAWAVSFAGHDFPGYNIGPIKRELEEKVVAGYRSGEVLRQNVLSLGVFDSVAGLGIEGFSDAGRIYEAMGLTNPTMTQMVQGAIAAMRDERLRGQIVNLDGGLREELATAGGRARYQSFIATLN